MNEETVVGVNSTRNDRVSVLQSLTNKIQNTRIDKQVKTHKLDNLIRANHTNFRTYNTVKLEKWRT